MQKTKMNSPKFTLMDFTRNKNNIKEILAAVSPSRLSATAND